MAITRSHWCLSNMLACYSLCNRMFKQLKLHNFKIINSSKTWPHIENLTIVLKSTPKIIPKTRSNLNPHEIHLKLLSCVIKQGI